jgi:hypothetical protein
MGCYVVFIKPIRPCMLRVRFENASHRILYNLALVSVISRLTLLFTSTNISNFSTAGTTACWVYTANFGKNYCCKSGLGKKNIPKASEMLRTAETPTTYYLFRTYYTYNPLQPHLFSFTNNQLPFTLNHCYFKVQISEFVQHLLLAWYLV